jgi:hypothetical protein
MPKILILGANGQLARNTTEFFLKHPDVQLTYTCAGHIGSETPIRAALPSSKAMFWM